MWNVECGVGLLHRLATAAQFRLHKLTLAYHLRMLLLAQRLATLAACVASRLRSVHLSLERVHLILQPLLRLLVLLHALQILSVVFNGCNLTVDGAYLALRTLEMAVGLLRVEHGRHEVRPVVPATKQARIGGKEAALQCALLVFILHNEHTEHLAAALLRAHQVGVGDVALQLQRRSLSKRVYVVAERIGELAG